MTLGARCEEAEGGVDEAAAVPGTGAGAGGGTGVEAGRGAVPTVSTLAAETLADLPALTERLVSRALAVEEPYRWIPIEEFSARAAANLGQTLADLAAGRPISVESQRETARRRAREGIPLASVLHAFRLGFTVIWEAMVARARAEGDDAMRALLEGTSTLWDIIDTHSAVVTVEYQATLSELARRDDDRRRLLIDALFDGRVAEWQSLQGSPRDVGLPPRGPYLAVSAETPRPGHEALPGMSRLLARHGFPSVWRLRADEEEGVVALSAGGAGAEAQARALLAEVATGRVGVSSEFGDAAATARALGAAALGRACLPPGRPGVANADDDVLTALVVSSPDPAARVAQVVLGPIRDMRPSERARLLETLDAWFAAGGAAGAVGATSRALGCHRNTVRNRLARVEELTGRSLADPRGTCELYLAMRISQLPGGGGAAGAAGGEGAAGAAEGGGG